MGRTGTRLAAASFVLALGAAVFVLVWPLYAGFGLDGSVVKRATLLAVNGAWVLIPVTIPVAIACLPLLFRRRWVRVTTAILLSVFSFISGFTIGLFYVPAAILLAVAACFASESDRADA